MDLIPFSFRLASLAKRFFFLGSSAGCYPALPRACPNLPSIKICMRLLRHLRHFCLICSFLDESLLMEIPTVSTVSHHFLYWPFWPYWPFPPKYGQNGQYGHVLFYTIFLLCTFCTFCTFHFQSAKSAMSFFNESAKFAVIIVPLWLRTRSLVVLIYS